METHLADWIKGTRDGDEADAILRACVHCGFCNATCPTYQMRGDELDGPRGRIYQIKQVLEGVQPTQSTQLHLDRCLTCLNCETTCPSGVRYGRLVDIGRMAVEQRVARRPFDALQAQRAAFRADAPLDFRSSRRARPRVAAAASRNAAQKTDAAARKPARRRKRTHARKVILLNGCVQPALMPSIDAATSRVLDALGVQTIVATDSGCCGAIDYHLNAHDAAREKARRNIDAWWPLIEAGAEAIVINASGCGAMVKDYAHVLRDDRVVCRESKAHRGDDARSIGIPRAADCANSQTNIGSDETAHRIPSAVHAAAHAENPRRGRIDARPRSAPNSCRSPMRICAADRPARIRFCSRRCRRNCARANWRIWSATGRTKS